MPHDPEEIVKPPERFDFLVTGEKGIDPGEKTWITVCIGIEERLGPNVESDPSPWGDFPDARDRLSLRRRE
jgi:hypothetical protein